MEHLADVTVDDLHRALDEVDGKKPTLRLVAAIAYKHGVAQTALAEWFDVERKTIYNWLTRLEGTDLDAELADATRPGRPRKLDADQLADLRTTLRDHPSDAGFEVPAWTTEAVQHLVRERYGVEYSRPSCRRFMREAGLRFVTHREAVALVDPTDRAAFEEWLRDLGHVWLPG